MYILSFSEWYICWCCFDLFYADFFWIFDTINTHVRIYANCFILFSNTLRFGMYGALNIFQQPRKYYMSFKRDILSLQVSFVINAKYFLLLIILKMTILTKYFLLTPFLEMLLQYCAVLAWKMEVSDSIF